MRGGWGLYPRVLSARRSTPHPDPPRANGERELTAVAETSNLRCHRLNNCRSTSFIAWLSWVACGMSVCVAAGGSGGAGSGEGDGCDGGGMLRPWLRACPGRTRPAIPAAADCPRSRRAAAERIGRSAAAAPECAGRCRRRARPIHRPSPPPAPPPPIRTGPCPFPSAWHRPRPGLSRMPCISG